jgi:hypothetical protein
MKTEIAQSTAGEGFTESWPKAGLRRIIGCGVKFLSGKMRLSGENYS